MDLAPIAQALLATFRVDRDAPRGDAAALLAERGYPAHPAALDFEARYGGLRIFAEDPEPALLVGPFACFSAGPYTGHERDLVPVMFGRDDTVYAVDATGAGWVCAAMVEGVSRPCARDGRALLGQAILWRALVRDFAFHDGRHGDALAATRGLPLLDELSTDGERWWGAGAQLVVEIPRGNGSTTPMTYATVAP